MYSFQLQWFSCFSFGVLVWTRYFKSKELYARNASRSPNWTTFPISQHLPTTLEPASLHITLDLIQQFSASPSTSKALYVCSILMLKIKLTLVKVPPALPFPGVLPFIHYNGLVNRISWPVSPQVHSSRDPILTNTNGRTTVQLPQSPHGRVAYYLPAAWKPSNPHAAFVMPRPNRSRSRLLPTRSKV